MYKGYIGTYNTDSTKGIYSFSFEEESGRLSDPALFFAADDAKCVDIERGKLFITLHHGENGGMAVLNAQTAQLQDAVYLEHKTPCFIKYADNLIYTANYHDGTVMIYQIRNFAAELVKRIDIMPKAGCHQVILHGHYIIVPCLLLDEVRIFDANDDYKQVKTIPFPAGTGPRHGIFNADHSRFYLVSELSNELFAFDVDGLDFKPSGKVPLLDRQQAKTSSGAAIRLSKDEQKLYISTRGADLLSVVSFNELNQPGLIQQVSCGGSHPRDFLLSDDERFLLCVNRDSDDLVSFSIEQPSGKIGGIVSKISVPHGVGITISKI